MTASVDDSAPPSSTIYDVDASDPLGELVDRSALSDAEVREVDALMASLARLRDAEQRLTEASLRYMKLNQTDMRALHYLIVAENRQTIVTPGTIATHLGISTASTTKLLDRLERAGHVTREPHPRDRRALTISIAPQTREAAMNTVGRQQAKRFYAAARLSTTERNIVARFLDDMANEIALTDVEWAKPGDSGS